MDTLLFVPSKSTRGRAQVRVLKAEFQRYEQRAADGPNNADLRDWTLIFAPVSKAQLEAIYEFFRVQGGWKKFWWTEPTPFNSDGPSAFVCEYWDWVYEGGDVVGVTAELLGRPPL